MSTLREKTDAQMNKTRENNPEFAKAVDALLKEAQNFKKGSEALSVGVMAPNFILPNAVGKSISLQKLLLKGAVVISFYRGSWCPYCNLQLKALSEHLDEIHDLNAEPVAISPQVPDESLNIIEKNNLTFPVLSDQDAKVAKSFGVSWNVPDILLEHMKNDRGLDLDRINNGNTKIMPIPATFIINLSLIHI